MKRRHKRLNKNNFLILLSQNIIIGIKKYLYFLYVNMIYIFYLPNEIIFNTKQIRMILN